MDSAEILTAEQFCEARPDLPENGRWMELVAGRIVTLDAPDDVHGNVVLNFSKAVAEHLGRRGETEHGYFCFELGVLVSRNPDTIYFPAACYFAGGARFSECDKVCTETPPQLVVDIASTKSRRRGTSDRVAAYHRIGVDVVWIVDTAEKQVHVARHGVSIVSYAEPDVVPGSPLEEGLELSVRGLFAVPSWWR